MEEIIQLYIYTDKFNNISYIGNSQKDFENKELIAKIYTINPEFSPIPFGTVLFCASYSETSEVNTLSVEQIYDPFNSEKKCVKFIAWKEKVPYSTPLYIMTSENGVYMTFDDIILGKEFKKETIFVLTKPIYNGEFLFSEQSGICIPDANGNSLKKCIENSSNKEFSIIQNLNFLYGGKKSNLKYLFLILILLLILLIYKIKN